MVGSAASPPAAPSSPSTGGFVSGSPVSNPTFGSPAQTAQNMPITGAITDNSAQAVGAPSPATPALSTTGGTTDTSVQAGVAPPPIAPNIPTTGAITDNSGQAGVPLATAAPDMGTAEDITEILGQAGVSPATAIPDMGTTEDITDTSDQVEVSPTPAESELNPPEDLIYNSGQYGETPIQEQTAPETENTEETVETPVVTPLQQTVPENAAISAPSQPEVIESPQNSEPETINNIQNLQTQTNQNEVEEINKPSTGTLESETESFNEPYGEEFPSASSQQYPEQIGYSETEGMVSSPSFAPQDIAMEEAESGYSQAQSATLPPSLNGPTATYAPTAVPINPQQSIPPNYNQGSYGVSEIEGVYPPQNQISPSLQASGLSAPSAVPGVQAPSAVPGVQAPSAVPGVQAPNVVPVVQAPNVAPGVQAPNIAPVVQAPNVAPVVQAPNVVPVVTPVYSPSSSQIVQQGVPEGIESCPEAVDSLGCFIFGPEQKNLFKTLMVSSKPGQSLEQLFCECGSMAERKGFTMFVLSNGQCYSGPISAGYEKSGPSENCVNDDDQPCGDGDTYCQGQEDAMSVYNIINQQKREAKKKGSRRN